MEVTLSITIWTTREDNALVDKDSSSPACKAFRQQTIVTNTHGGAANSRLSIVLKPKVDVNLAKKESIHIWVLTTIYTYVGKKFMKLSPKSSEHTMNPNNGTLGSFKAWINPENALHSDSNAVRLIHGRCELTFLCRNPGPLRQHLLQGESVLTVFEMAKAIACCVAKEDISRYTRMWQLWPT